MAEPSAPYGLVASFANAEALGEAVRRSQQAGYQRIETYAPLPCEAISQSLGHDDRKVPAIALGCGLAGAVIAYGLQYYSAVVDLPLVVGGKPFHAWPTFLVLAFEIGILSAVLGAVIGMLLLNRLPEPYHPVFDAPEFDRASLDRYFLCIHAGDAAFDARSTRAFLESLTPLSIDQVPK